MKSCMQRVVELCEIKGITRVDLCKAIDVPVSTLSNWIYRDGTPKYEHLRKIASYFGVSIAYLTTGQESNLNLRREVEELINRIAALPEKKQANVLRLMYEVIASAEE